jgi:hypothetical protein
VPIDDLVLQVDSGKDEGVSDEGVLGTFKAI